MNIRMPAAAAASALLVSFAILYREVIVKLVADWAGDGNYSHGFLIVPLAAYFAWQRRDRLATASRSPSVAGLGLVGASLLLLVAGELGAELFLTRISMLIMTVGGVAFVWGWRHARILAFPLSFLLLMIPIPAIVFNQIAFPLQLVASRVGEATLNVVHIPVLREGNVIILANTTLEVAEACSGIRSLVSLFTLGIVYGYFTDPRGGVRSVIAFATIPVAILSNGLRVAGTGIAAHMYGPAAAEGFFHMFSGWIVFIAAFVMLFIVLRVVQWLLPAARRSPAPIVRLA